MGESAARRWEQEKNRRGQDNKLQDATGEQGFHARFGARPVVVAESFFSLLLLFMTVLLY